jgi:hypothetical protein
VAGPDWLAWHDDYDRPDSRLQRRLVVVQARIREALDAAGPGPIRVISLCAGQGRDLLGVLSDHPRRNDVRARLVESDPRNVELARRGAPPQVDIVEGDASTTSAYVDAVPAELVLACGVFGNVIDDDIRNTVGHLPALCAPNATVIWTRHPRDESMLATIDGWFQDTGFRRLWLEGTPADGFGVGAHQLVIPPRPYEPDVRLFTFVS